MRTPAWILRLAREGSASRSQIASESEPMLAQLKALGLATEEVHGSKRRVVAHDRAALNHWVAATYPSSIETPHSGLRAGNIARVRRSKAGAFTHDVQPLLLRWFEPDVSAPLAVLTRHLGLVGLTTDRVGTLQPPDPWTLLTIENWESFMMANYENCSEAVVVAYTEGNIADMTVRALASIKHPPQRAVHFGDYDWAGLAIYRRMRATISALQLYVPNNIATLFVQFGDAALLIRQSPLTALENDTSEVRQVIALIAQYNAGLEQEIVPPPQFPGS